MSKKAKERKPAEDSLFLRMLWLALTFTCFYLIALVDPNISCFSLFGLKMPLLFVYFWVAVSGSYMSYYYRHQEVKWLEYIGLSMVLLSFSWFIGDIQRQLLAGGDLDLLLPTVNMVAGMYVSHSFELRTRFDFNFSLGVSLLIVCYAATLGKGAWFGLGMFVYVVLAAALLLLDCEARTFGRVQARIVDDAESYLTFSRSANSEKTANLVVPTLALLLLSICFFLVVPRAESLADQVSARIYSLVRNNLAPPSAVNQAIYRRVRTPRKPKRPDNMPPEPQESDIDHSKMNDDRAADRNSPAAAGMARKDKYQENYGQNKSGETDAGEAGKASEAGKKVRRPYSREAEKAKRENAAKQSSYNEESENAASPSNRFAGEKNGTQPESAGNKDGAGIDKNLSVNGNSAAKSGKALPKQAPAESQNQGNNPPGNSSGADKGSHPQDRQAASRPGKKSFEGHDSAGKKTGKDPSKSDDSQNKEIEGYLPDTLETDRPGSTQDVPIFSVACNRTVLFRQGAFDYYDGHRWQISPGIARFNLERGPKGTFNFKDVFPLTLPGTVPAIRLTQKYHVFKNLGAKLIIAGSPSEIAYPGPSINVDTCGNLKGSWFLVKGLEYSVYADEPMYDLEAMRHEGVPDEAEESALRLSFSKFLQVPDNQSERLYDLSQEVAGLQDNWFVQAEKICSYLRHNYKYSSQRNYKTQVKNSADRFIFQSKAGDCKDFAAAFVLMCRASGIPARMVVGFTSGEFDPATGTRVVKLKNSHAWGEIYFPSSGWVPFDATPTGFMPAKQKEEERYFTTVGKNVEDSLKQVRVVEGSGQTGNLPEIRLPLPNGHVETITINLWDIFKWLPLVLAALVLSGPLMIFFRSIIKRIRWPRAMHPASKVYMRALRDLKTLGVASPESQTPGEFLEKIREKLAESGQEAQSRKLAQAVEDFISCYNATYYGARGSTAELEKRRLQIRELLKK